jgi:cobalamin biosynthesis Mg chelatase CobN
MLLQAIKMSSEKQVPLTLHHNKTERGHYGKSAPIHYAPKQDPVQGSLSEAMVSTNIVKMPGGTKTDVKVWSGHGNNEALLNIAQQLGGLIKRLGYWQAVKEANEAVATAKQALVDASSALKAAKKEESKTQNNASASDAKKAEALEKKTAASTTVDAAKLELEQAEEDRSKAAEKPSSFTGATSRRTNRPLGKRSSPI